MADRIGSNGGDIIGVDGIVVAKIIVRHVSRILAESIPINTLRNKKKYFQI